MMRRLAYLVPLLFLSAPILVPTAAACSLTGYEPFSRNQWIDERYVLTPYYGGVGVFDTEAKNFTLAFNALHVSHAVVSPDGTWLVVSYWNGALDADCSHDVEAVDAFHMETGERHPLLAPAASAFAPTPQGLAVFGFDRDRVPFYTWGDWDSPTYIQFRFPSRPDLHADRVQFAALTPDRAWLAVLHEGHVIVIDLAETKEVVYDVPFATQYHAGGNPFAFDPTGTHLAWVAAYDESTLKVVKLDQKGSEQVASRTEPTVKGGPLFTGFSVWNENGLVLPLADRVRWFPDPFDLSKFEDILLEGVPQGESDWSPSGERLFVGGRIGGESEPWLPMYWIFDTELEEIENYTAPTMHVRPTSTLWKDVPQGNENPRDDRYADQVPHDTPAFFAPNIGLIPLVLVLVLVIVASSRQGPKKA